MGIALCVEKYRYLCTRKAKRVVVVPPMPTLGRKDIHLPCRFKTMFTAIFRFCGDPKVLPSQNKLFCYRKDGVCKGKRWHFGKQNKLFCYE